MIHSELEKTDIFDQIQDLGLHLSREEAAHAIVKLPTRSRNCNPRLSEERAIPSRASGS